MSCGTPMRCGDSMSSGGPRSPAVVRTALQWILFPTGPRAGSGQHSSAMYPGSENSWVSEVRFRNQDAEFEGDE